MSEVHVLVPALWPSQRWLEQEPLQLPRLPVLQRCLGRARPVEPTHGDTFESRLFSLFGVCKHGNRDLPVAAATHWVDFPHDHNGCWLRIDPVHLHPELGELLLFDAHHFDLQPEETTALLAELNAYLSEEGLHIVAGSASDRWYLRIQTAPSMQTTPPHRINGQHIDAHLPSGADARRWQRLVTELQMLLHASVVNAEREKRGQPAINSVWIWGAGSLPPLQSNRWSLVATDEEVTAGLANAAGSRIVSPAAWLTDPAPAAGNVLVVPAQGYGALARQDHDRWQADVEDLDRRCFSEMQAKLNRRHFEAIVWHQAGGCWRLNRGDLWRFWRHAAPAHTVLAVRSISAPG